VSYVSARAATVRYLIERKGKKGVTFYFKRDVPETFRDVLGLTQWWQSLKRAETLGQAESSVRRINAEIDAQIATLKSMTGTELTKEGCLRIRRDLDQAIARCQVDWQRDSLRRDSIVDTIALLAGRGAATPAFLTDYRDTRLAVDGWRIVEQTVPPLTLEQIASLPEGEQVAAIRYARSVAAYKADANASLLPLQATMDSLDILPPDAAAPCSMTIRALCEAWLADRGYKPEIARKHRTVFRRLEEHIGNISISNLTDIALETFIEAVRQLPDTATLGDGMRSATMSELLAWAKRDAAELAAEKLANPNTTRKPHPAIVATYVAKYVSTLQLACAWASMPRRKLFKDSPAAHLERPDDTRKKQEKRRHPLTVDELNCALHHASVLWADKPEWILILRLAIYSGARLGEICQLARDNLIEHKSGGYCIQIDDADGRSIKNEASERLMPVHGALLPDLLAHAATIKSGFLFPSVATHRRAASLSTAFSALLKEHCGVIVTKARRVSFHSIRHTFADTCKDSIPDVGARVLLGHADRNDRNDYGTGPRLAKVRQWVDMLQPLGATATE
jgi:integrase